MRICWGLNLTFWHYVLHLVTEDLSHTFMKLLRPVPIYYH